MQHEHVLNGETVVLVQPCHIGAHWTRDNLIFRSSVWTTDGELISASFKKFFNDQEQPNLDPLPKDIRFGSLLEKIDGSTAIFSLRHSNLIIRTRGTVDARTNDNGDEFVQLAEKYCVKEILEEIAPNEDVSLLFEITSPNCKIILDYGPEADLTLIGAVRHLDYSYFTQDELDELAANYDLRRPQRYSFDSLDDMRNTVAAFQGKKGICFYYNDDQCIRKFKSTSYLRLHRVKSEVSSLEKVIDLYLDRWTIDGRFYSYDEFFTYLERTFDFEIAVMARGHVSRICDAMKEVEKIIHAMRNFLTPFMVSDASRKDVALAIQQAYGTTGRAGLAFKTYDRKPLVPDDIKRLLFQCLKN